MRAREGVDARHGRQGPHPRRRRAAHSGASSARSALEASSAPAARSPASPESQAQSHRVIDRPAGSWIRLMRVRSGGGTDAPSWADSSIAADAIAQDVRRRHGAALVSAAAGRAGPARRRARGTDAPRRLRANPRAFAFSSRNDRLDEREVAPRSHAPPLSTCVLAMPGSNSGAAEVHAQKGTLALERDETRACPPAGAARAARLGHTPASAGRALSDSFDVWTLNSLSNAGIVERHQAQSRAHRQAGTSGPCRDRSASRRSGAGSMPRWNEEPAEDGVAVGVLAAAGRVAAAHFRPPRTGSGRCGRGRDRRSETIRAC
jgi:hypothetical protein